MEEDISSSEIPMDHRFSEEKKISLSERNKSVIVTEIRETSHGDDVEFDLDPRLPEPNKKMGPVEDTLSILVDENDPAKVLQIGSRLDSTLRASLVNFLKITWMFLRGAPQIWLELIKRSCVII